MRAFSFGRNYFLSAHSDVWHTRHSLPDLRSYRYRFNSDTHLEVEP
jgi:hypothetical protein